mgnify:CR=1 FL=1
MAQLTKQAIIDSFIELLNTHPLDQITVTDIAKKCGISRRTFYHYYQDIYQLPEELFLAETRKILKDKTDFHTWESWFIKMLDFAFQNKTAVMHIYHSVRREYLERYIFSVADKTLTDYIARLAEGADCDQTDICMIASFYTSAVVGLAFDWIRRGMIEDPKTVIVKYVSLLKGTIQCALKNCGGQNALPGGPEGYAI